MWGRGVGAGAFGGGGVGRWEVPACLHRVGGLRDAPAARIARQAVASERPLPRAQAAGRAWRMGQRQPVTVKRLYVKGSVRALEGLQALGMTGFDALPLAPPASSDPFTCLSKRVAATAMGRALRRHRGRP